MNEDVAREYLRRVGASDRLVAGGLPGLVEEWERITASIAGGYQLDLDSYLNDMDLRELIEEILTLVEPVEAESVASRVRVADGQARAVLKPSNRCLWGDVAAREAGWSVEKNWWYFNVPSNAGAELREDLKRFDR